MCLSRRETPALEPDDHREPPAMLNWNLRLLRGPAPGMMFRCWLIFTLGIAVMLSFPRVSAHLAISVADRPSIQLNVCFNARYSTGNWVLIQVTLSNSG